MQPTNGAKWPKDKDEVGVVVMEEAGVTQTVHDVVELALGCRRRAKQL